MRGRLPLATVLALIFLVRLSGVARAQVGASVSVDSNYLLRGVSLSGGRPVATVNLSYDHKSGVYAGGVLLAVFSRGAGPQPLGYIAYVGYSAHLPAGFAWDAGVSNSGFTEYVDKRYSDDYTEVFVGLSRGDISAHVYFSPNYIGLDSSTVYAELNASVRPTTHWRLFGHAGILSVLGGSTRQRERGDALIGVAREFGNLEAHASFSASDPAPTYPPGYKQAPEAVLVGATVFF